MEHTDEFTAHVRDLGRAAASRGRPRFTAFLTGSEPQRAAAAFRAAGCVPAFWGGHEEAERQVAGAFPPGEDTRRELFPVTAFGVRIPKGFTLTHRDFLGAILALGIKREVVGDILIDGEKAFFFALDTAAPLILGELRRVGSVGVEVFPAGAREADAAGIGQRFEERVITVASPRLDAVAAGLARVSRGEAARLIEAGLVSVDGETCQKCTRVLAGGERVSVRGKGKFLVGIKGGTTRKGRVVIEGKRYL